MKLSAIQKFTLLDFPGKVACMAFTPGCDLRCGFCHNPEFVLPEQLCRLAASFIPEADFFSFLGQRRGLLEGVVVTGGEPTIWHDLPSFLAEVKRLGFAVKLDTNGNNSAMLNTCITAGLVDYIAMDVKTSLEQYPSLVGPGVQPERIRESIVLIRDSGVAHEFRSTLIREHHTASVLHSMSRLLQGAERVFLQAFRPEQTLDPAFRDATSFSRNELEIIASQFGTRVKHVGVRI